MAAARLARGAIDVHTHVYLPRYLRVLRERSTVPKVLTFGGKDRIVILPGEVC
jgi:aminocarboxymuconate-semialdehyde decarboxylase